jgi:hypothetical protein
VATPPPNLPNVARDLAPAPPTSAPARSVEADDRGGGIGVATWVSGAVAVAALAAGTAFGVTALSQQSDFDAVVDAARQEPPGSPDLAQIRADGEAISSTQATNALIADILFGTAVVSAGIAVYTLLTGDGEAEETGVVSVTPDGVTVTVGGRF